MILVEWISKAALRQHLFREFLVGVASLLVGPVYPYNEIYLLLKRILKRTAFYSMHTN